jgi:adenine-specific DNA-methyltransferase
MKTLIDEGWAGKISCVCTDPPYNTGDQLLYQDTRGRALGSGAHRRGHTQWTNFMRPRVLLMHELLSETGTLIMAIDDSEVAYLRILLDSVFGEENFISMLIHSGQIGSTRPLIANTADYMLIYTKSRQALKKANIKWREPKEGVDKLLETARRIAREANSPKEATARWQKHLRGLQNPPSGVRQYTRLTEDGRPWRRGPLVSPGTARYSYDIIHPVTGRACAKPARGWRMTRETFEKMQAEGRIVFGPDESVQPAAMLYLDEHTAAAASNVFYAPRKHAADRLADLFGIRRTPFPFPKDPDILARWIRLVTLNDPGAVILDPFAGSGTTAEAVMELNRADEGARSSILITLDEGEDVPPHLRDQAGIAASGVTGGIVSSITVPRLKALESGIRVDGTPWGEGFHQRVVVAECEKH